MKAGTGGFKLISTAPKLLSFILATPSTKPHSPSHTHFPQLQPANCFMCQDLCLCPCFIYFFCGAFAALSRPKHVCTVFASHAHQPDWEKLLFLEEGVSTLGKPKLKMYT